MRIKLLLKNHYLILLIILLGFLLRFYQLGSTPPSMNIDEVSIGYNAYSILKTGHDEFGKFFPLSFRSYDDYKPPLYIYLVVPAIAILGLTDFAVRFPAALMGTLAILTTYLFVRELFPHKKSIAMFSALLLAITPWHLQFTRTAFEVGGMAFLTTLGLFLYLKGLRRKQLLLIALSGLILALEGFLYQAARLFTPLLGLVLLAIYLIPLIWQKQWKRLLTVGFSFGIVFLLLFGPIIFLTLSPEGQARFQGTSIFQDFEPHAQGVAFQTTDWLSADRLVVLAFHQEPLFYLQKIAVGYFTHLRLDFLYLGLGGVKVNLIPHVGLELLWTLPFLLIGLFYLFDYHDKRVIGLLLGWLLISPIPAALTWDIPTSIRTAVMLPVLEIIVSLGIVMIVSKLHKTPRLRLPALLFIAATGVYFFAYMLHMLFFHLPEYLSKQWYAPYREVVETTMRLAPNYDKVIVGTNLDQPHGFFLYYSHYDPKTYLDKDGGTVSGSYTTTANHLANIYFEHLGFDQIKEKNVLVVGHRGDFPRELKPLFVFPVGTAENDIVIVEKQ